jgi:hypothetical protein
LSVSGKLDWHALDSATCVKPAFFGLLCAWREVLILHQHNLDGTLTRQRNNYHLFLATQGFKCTGQLLFSACSFSSCIHLKLDIIFTRPKTGEIFVSPLRHIIKKGEPSDRALMARITHKP